ncbi:class I adenylate-forming enzyme family protein [Pseudonocardia bannensis]|uniref:Long-chain fatty acid--CoA ligase n=1 Tax=Pseudonocardia bannensis TaxID=630973 RepID=A0A848DPE8_9PSEU|nr:AMP-binding protein [Pseudonocardia bannensis]NMH94316.1 long-chain fatty acid--CoA ligase [Pseudonocardia bannensis]
MERTALTLDYPEVPAGAILAGAAHRFGDRTALHYYGRELSFAQLRDRAGAFANALRDAGVGRGDIVAIHLPNCPQYAIAYYGILLAGATFSPTNPLLPPADLAAQLADAGAVAAVSWLPAVPAIAAVRDRTAIRLLLVTDREQALDPGSRVDLTGVPGAVDFEAFHADAPTRAPDVDVDVAGDLAHLAYTGGTTGRSKGVQLPHRNVVINALQYACWGSGSVPVLDAEGGLVLEQTAPAEEYPVRLGTGVSINLTPWFHAMGTIGALNVPMLTGSTTVLHDRFDPGAYLADAERFRVTSMAGAPPLFAAMLRHPDFATRDLSSVRGLTSGAAPLPVEMIQALHRRFGSDAVIAEGYGLTEVTMGATIGPAARSAVRKVGTVGQPVYDTEIRILDDDGAQLPPGEPGEVCIRGPQVMTGYRNRPEETAATLVDGWLHTGDIGVLDDEGYLSIVDRKKDMLIYKGYNVYPRELEELLFGQPGVVGAAVVGKQDPEVGELPVAFVVAPGLDGDGAQKLMDAVNDQVTPYKRLREIRLVDEIPVSAAGKVLKRELRTRLSD